jgi:ribosome biogenesis GTPase
MENEDLGYNIFFESNRHKLGLDEFSVARVTFESRGAYKIKNTNGEYFAKITGKQMFTASSREDYPAVGDWVAIKELNNEQAVIQSILPRMTIIERKHGDKSRLGEKDKTQIIAANIDVAFIVESVDRDYNLNRFERYFTIARNGGVKSAIILNKTDLISKKELDERFVQIKNRIPDVTTILTSIINDDGLDDLKKYIEKGKTYCFLGSSGVGKSSLVNKLLGKDVIKTESISLYSGRGKHITTNRQMYFLENGGIVIDNPGIREVGLTDMGDGINSFFDEITNLSRGCKYIDCTHIHEPDCKVLAAVKSGKLDEEKYSNYVNLKKEAEYYEMADVEKKKKDHQFGKFVKRAKKEFKKFGLKDY